VENNPKWFPDMELSSTDRAKIEHFRNAFGEEHFMFACQASVPLIFSTDLLYKLWVNFNTYVSGGLVKKIPHWAVSDLILSALCEPVGFQLYRLGSDTRTYLQRMLVDELQEGRRIQIAEFLKQFAEKYYASAEKNIQEIHLFTADSILDPGAMGQRLSNKLQEKIEQGNGEVVNLLSLYFNLSGETTASPNSESYITLVEEDDPTTPGYLNVRLPGFLQEKVRQKTTPNDRSIYIDESVREVTTSMLLQDCLLSGMKTVDLGNCGLTDIDFEENSLLSLDLRNCDHIEVLILSNEWWDHQSDSRVQSRNKKEGNFLTVLPPAISHLKKLTTLICAGTKEKKWKIKDVTPLFQLAELQQLDLSANEITSLSGWPVMPKLKHLDLSGNDIDQLHDWQAERFPALNYLNVYGNKLRLVHELNKLTSLQTLNLGRNRLTVIEGLEGLTGLTKILLNENRLTSTIGLENAESLTYIDLRGNPLNDISGLYYFIKNGGNLLVNNAKMQVPTLDIVNQGSDAILKYFEQKDSDNIALQLIRECSASGNTVLELGHCGLSDASFEVGTVLEQALRKCRHVEKLNLSNEWWTLEEQNFRYSHNQGEPNVLTKFPIVFYRMTRLNTLICGGDNGSNWGITDMSFAEQFPQLTYLDVSNNKLTKIEGVSQLSLLSQLLLYNNEIEEMVALDTLANLKLLSLENNHIRSIRGLEKNISLQYLYLWRNKIQKIEGLDTLKQLIYLALSYNNIEVPEGLSQLTALEILHLGNNSLNTIDQLAELKSLRYLYLNNNMIVSIAPLAKLSKLEGLWLQANDITDIAALAELPALNYVDLNHNAITDLQPLTALLKKSIPLRNAPEEKDESGVFVGNNHLTAQMAGAVEKGKEAVLDLLNRKDKVIKTIYLSSSNKDGLTSLFMKPFQEWLDRSIMYTFVLTPVNNTWTYKSIEEEIKSLIRQADIFIPLVSADYLSDMTCLDEFQQAFAQKKTILPILLGDCDFTKVRVFNELEFYFPPGSMVEGSGVKTSFSSYLEAGTYSRMEDQAINDFMRGLLSTIENKVGEDASRLVNTSGTRVGHQRVLITFTGRRLKYKLNYDGVEVEASNTVNGELSPLRSGAMRSIWDKSLLMPFWEMIPETIRQVFEKVESLCLVLDDNTMRYPWEHFTDRNGRPMGMWWKIVRKHVSSPGRVFVRADNVLIISRPQNVQSIDLPFVEREGAALSTLMQLNNFNVRFSLGESGPKIRAAILDKPYKLVHLCSFGLRELESRENAFEQNYERQSENADNKRGFPAFEYIPELVFLNCREGVLLADTLLRSGAQIIHTTFDVDDSVAAFFAQAVYESLFEGNTLAAAMLYARMRTRQSFISKEDWASFVCYGEEDYQLLLSGTGVREKVPVTKEEFIDALRQLRSQFMQGSVRNEKLEEQYNRITAAFELQKELANDVGVLELLAASGIELGLSTRALAIYDQLIGQARLLNDIPKEIFYSEEAHKGMRQLFSESVDKLTTGEAFGDTAANLADKYELAGNLDGAIRIRYERLSLLQSIYAGMDHETQRMGKLLSAYSAVGNTRMLLKQYKDAEAIYEVQLDLAKRQYLLDPSDRLRALYLATANEKLADVFTVTLETDKAIGYLEEAIRVYREVEKIDGGGVYPSLLADQLEKLGDLFWNRGEIEKAMPAYEEAVSRVQVSFEKYKENPVYAKRMVHLLLKAAYIRLAIARQMAALDYFERAMQTAQQLLTDFPLRKEFYYDLALAYEGMAVYYQHERKDEKLLNTYLDEAEKTARRVHEDFPNNPLFLDAWNRIRAFRNEPGRAQQYIRMPG
jgi:Leucine-rich repeat (LRR) protein/tetratricopeptide (TPR) repeat protein